MLFCRWLFLNYVLDDFFSEKLCFRLFFLERARRKWVLDSLLKEKAFVIVEM